MKEQQDMQIRKFNPGTFQSDEAVIEQFVVRQRELGVVLEVLSGNINASSCQHTLIVAPRGRGKTMLLARVAAELRTKREFSERLFPVRFMEESQEVFNIADFWLETLFYLARELASSDPEFSKELRSTYDALAGQWHDEGLDKRALATVLDAADRLGKQLVLMVENLQSLCEDTDDDFGWQLRKTLQSENQIMLLASATSRFEGLEDAQQPFFELFQLVYLHPLDTAECRCLWQVVSGDAVSEREIKPLQILTGGSPRLLVIVAAFARHRSLRQLMEELVTLIDDHTEYFRGHLESLAKTERRVYLAVIDLWQESSTGEIAARARMDVRTVSTLLGRLVKRGAVIMEGRGKKRLYAAAERLYSIYYKLRRERDEAAVVRNFIHFMVVFYNHSELVELSRNLVAEAMLSPVIRHGIERAVAEIPQARSLFPDEFFVSTDSDRAESDNGRMSRLLEEITAAYDAGAFERVIEIADQISSSVDFDSPTESMVAIGPLIMKGLAQGALGESAAAIVISDEVVRRFGANDDRLFQVFVASALVNKGIWQSKLEESAAIATYDEVVKRFGASGDHELQVLVALALVNKGYWQGELGESAAAIATYDEVVKRFAATDDRELQVQVAMALVNKGEMQRKTGYSDGALSTFEEIEREFGTLIDNHSVPVEWWARWVKAKAFLGQEKFVDAMRVFQSLYASFDPGNAMMMRAMQERVAELIGAGAKESAVLEVLSSDKNKCEAITPLVVAIRQEAGETVRAPAEVLEVAADIRERIRTMRYAVEGMTNNK